MSSKNPLVHTKLKMIKEGINDMETKYNVVKKSITRHKGKIKIDAINEIDKPHASKSKKINLSAMNQTKIMSFD